MFIGFNFKDVFFLILINLINYFFIEKIIITLLLFPIINSAIYFILNASKLTINNEGLSLGVFNKITINWDEIVSLKIYNGRFIKYLEIETIDEKYRFYGSSRLLKALDRFKEFIPEKLYPLLPPNLQE